MQICLPLIFIVINYPIANIRKVYLVDKTNPKLKTSAYQFVGTTVEVVDVEVI